MAYNSVTKEPTLTVIISGRIRRRTIIVSSAKEKSRRLQRTKFCYHENKTVAKENENIRHTVSAALCIKILALWPVNSLDPLC
jgi:hypothetical protein